MAMEKKLTAEDFKIIKVDSYNCEECDLNGLCCNDEKTEVTDLYSDLFYKNNERGCSEGFIFKLKQKEE